MAHEAGDSQKVGHACAHCGAPLVYVRSEDGGRWLRPLDPPSRTAEPGAGRVLVVQVDGEWRAVPRVREMVFHVCSVEVVGTGRAPSKVTDIGVAPRVRRARERGASLATRRQLEEEKRKAALAREVEKRVATYWKPGSKADQTMQVKCPEPRCAAPAGEPCRSLQKPRRDARDIVLMGPHPARRAAVPKTEKQLAREARMAETLAEKARRAALEELEPLVSWLQVARVARVTGDPDELGAWLTFHADLFEAVGSPGVG